jgi:hypothetical protein
MACQSPSEKRLRSICVVSIFDSLWRNRCQLKLLFRLTPSVLLRAPEEDVPAFGQILKQGRDHCISVALSYGLTQRQIILFGQIGNGAAVQDCIKIATANLPEPNPD